MSSKKKEQQEKSEVISVRLQRNEINKIDDLAKELQTSRSKVVVMAIRNMIPWQTLRG